MPFITHGIFRDAAMDCKDQYKVSHNLSCGIPYSYLFHCADHLHISIAGFIFRMWGVFFGIIQY